MIYFLVTTSLYNDCPIRKSQYTNGINNLKRMIHKLQINNCKIIIIENNGVETVVCLSYKYLYNIIKSIFYYIKISI
jgi:hypothetical protein